MELIGSQEEAEQDVLRSLRRLVASVRSLVAIDPEDIESGISMLEQLRHDHYEDLNQIQHEAMILRTAKSIQSTEFPDHPMTWFWNPRQTGDADEPDLRGKFGTQYVVSAEITTSERPVGTIDTRMATTLDNLSRMPGRRFFVVRTPSMMRRAQTKIAKAGYDIEVRLEALR